jgi:hypothetical protein
MRDYLKITKDEIVEFTKSLTSTDEFKMLEEDFKKICEFVSCDGCTGVPDWYKTACSAHDFRYATRRDFNGEPITRAETDALFRKHIQSKSPFGRLSLMSYWRWFGVRLLGGKFWQDVK